MNKYGVLFLEYQKGYGLKESTLKRSWYYLKRFFNWLEKKDIRDVKTVDLLSYIEWLRGRKNNRNEPIKPASIEVEISLLKSFFEYLYKSDELLINPMEDFTIKQEGSSKKRAIFTEDDISLFLDSIGLESAVGQRDRAVFELMYSSGFRVGEILNLKNGDVNLEERVCFSIRKGDREMYIPFSEAAKKYLLKYINDGRKQHSRKIRKSEVKEYLFLNSSGKLSWHVTHIRFLRYLKNSGLDKKGYTMHSIRHATATHLLTHGADLRYVQELLGHGSLKSTQIYTRPTEENIKRIYRTYHPRENEYYREIGSDYLNALEALKREIVMNRETQNRKKGLKNC